MKTKFIDHNELYDGSQLRPLYNYLVHKTLGTSVISWVGPCDVSLEMMKDGEDVLKNAKIQSDSMLHFIFEIFERDLFSGVCLQRLFINLIKEEIFKVYEVYLYRSGDDLYLRNKGGILDQKFNVSIACPSISSTLIHIGLNVKNEGTPVSTSSISDFSKKEGSSLEAEVKKLAHDLMASFLEELDQIQNAVMKVRS